MRAAKGSGIVSSFFIYNSVVRVDAREGHLAVEIESPKEAEVEVGV